MAIDPTIAIRAGQSGMNLSEVFMQAERLKGLRHQRERSEWEAQQAQDTAQREAGARESLAGLVLMQTKDAPGVQRGGKIESEPGTRPVDQDGGDFAPLGPAQPNPWEEYVRLDPEGALDFRATTSDWQREEFEQARELNEGVMQLLGGVSDQESYKRAKNRARALYGRFGMRLDDFNLPEQYSPDLIRELQMQGMNTRQQLDTLLDERRFEWDQEDDQLDNERMAQREADLARDREARRAEARRAAERRDATTRRGQDRRVRTGRKDDSDDLPVASSPAQARNLPPGSRFKTPDGRILRVPAR